MTGEPAPTRVRGLAHRLRWSVADQAISSLGTFLMTVVVARSVGAASFGAFALAFAGYSVAIGVARAVVAEPAAVIAATNEPTSAATDGGGLAAVVAAVAGALGALVAIALPGDLSELRTLWLALCLLLPGLVLQDVARTILIVAARPRAAFTNDLMWLTLQFAGFGIAIASGRATATVLFAVWGVSGSLAAIAGFVQLGHAPRMTHAGKWARTTRALWQAFVVENLAMAAGWQIALVALATVSDVVAVGAVRGAQTLYGPISLIYLAMPLTIVPFLSTLTASTQPGELRRRCAQLSVALAVVALLGTALIASLPATAGTALLGDSWMAVKRLAIGFGIYVAFTGVNWGALLGLRALAATRSSMRVRLSSVLLTVTATTAGAAIDGARTFVAGLAVATAISSALWWSALMSATRSEGGGHVEPGPRRRSATAAPG